MSSTLFSFPPVDVLLSKYSSRKAVKQKLTFICISSARVDSLNSPLVAYSEREKTGDDAKIFDALKLIDAQGRLAAVHSRPPGEISVKFSGAFSIQHVVVDFCFQSGGFAP